MTLSELKKQASAILAIEPATGGYSHVTFTCQSGGRPLNTIGLTVVHSNEKLAYETVANGTAYSGSITIECRDTGTRDADGRTIYEVPDGRVFVYDYSHGSAMSFDFGFLSEPKIKYIG
jgi:hypothetical protein